MRSLAIVLGCTCAVLTLGAAISVETPKGEVDRVIYSDALQHPTPFTIAFRITPSPYAYDRTRIGKAGLVCASGNGYHNGFRVTLLPEMDNSLNGYRMSISFATNGNGHVSLPVPGILTTGRQYAIAFVWDGQEIRSYLNGTFGSKCALAGYTAPRHRFTVGPAGYGVGFCPISIEGFTIWEHVLSDDQILAITTGLSEGSVNGSADMPAGVTDLKSVKDYLVGLDAAAFSDMRALAWNTARKLADSGSRAEAAKLYRLLAERAPASRDYDGGNLSAARFAEHYGESAVVSAVAGLRTMPPVERGGWRHGEFTIDRSRAKYVAEDGDDANGDGTRKRPFATLSKALASVRGTACRQIVVRGGRYGALSQTVIGAEDSGTSAAPLIIESEVGETAMFDAGVEICGFKKCGRGDILCADVSAKGIDLTKPSHWGYACGGERYLAELCEDDQALQLSRHPNRGFLTTYDCDKTNLTFRLDLPNLEAWANEPELMALSYMRWYWGDETTALTIDPKSGLMHVDRDRIKRVGPDRPVRLVNALAAIDEPGEWFLDHKAARLYYWPMKEGARVELSQSREPIILLNAVSNVVIRGLTFQATRATAVSMNGVRNVLFQRNVIRNCGSALYVRGQDVEISDNRMRSFSFGAISAYGGDRTDLVPAGIRILGNDISDVERRQRTYCPFVQAEGCGIEIAYNHMHDAPSSAMRLEGNDILVCSNIVERCVLESDDQGAVDIYANPTYAGIEIVGNTWRDIGSPDCVGYVGQAAVRLDDVISGVRIRQNRFYNCGYKYFGAVQINGGRLNEVDNNLFVNCRRDVTINIRLPKWWNDVMTTGRYAKRVNALRLSEEPYRSRYPYLKDILAWPCMNFVSRSILVDTPQSCRAIGENGNISFPVEPNDVPEGYDPIPKAIAPMAVRCQ